MTDQNQASALPETSPEISDDALSQALFEYWKQQQAHKRNPSVYPEPSPAITVDPKYQNYYDFWVQHNTEAEMPASSSGQLDFIRHDREASEVVSVMGYLLVFISILFALCIRWIRTHREESEARMTERAEGRILRIETEKWGKATVRMAVVEFACRGQRQERKYRTSDAMLEGQPVTILYDPEDLKNSKMDGQQDPGERELRIISIVLFSIGIILLILVTL